MIRFPALAALVLIALAATGARSEELVHLCEEHTSGRLVVEDGTPDDARRFAGAFDGKWSNELDHVLIVDRIAADGTADAHYAWGRFPAWGIDTPGCRRHSGTIRDGVLYVRISRDREARYTFAPDGQLLGEYQLRSGISIGLFQKFDPQNPAPPFALNPPERAVFPSGYVSELVPTSLAENGRPLRLQMIVSRPEGPGPFPLLVFNHGSTGKGDREAVARAVRVSHPITRHFLNRGWMVVSPQRRGRGWSDGLHDEGMLNDRSRYSCEPRVTLAGLDQAVADLDAAMEVVLGWPEVDTDRVVIGGNSRGGMTALAYAAEHPGKAGGILNVVGGWLGTGCASYTHVHRRIAENAARSGTPTLWLYGGKDPLYGLDRTRTIFEIFESAGGKGEFVAFPESGHSLLWQDSKWTAPLDSFMAALGHGEFAR